MQTAKSGSTHTFSHLYANAEVDGVESIHCNVSTTDSDCLKAKSARGLSSRNIYHFIQMDLKWTHLEANT